MVVSIGSVVASVVWAGAVGWVVAAGIPTQPVKIMQQAKNNVRMHCFFIGFSLLMLAQLSTVLL
jgi:hypothetical protein